MKADKKVFLYHYILFKIKFLFGIDLKTLVLISK